MEAWGRRSSSSVRTDGSSPGFQTSSRLVVCTFDENEPRLAAQRGPIELSFRGRPTVLVFVAVVVAEQADIDRAAIDLVQIYLISPAVGGREVFEQECREVSSQECVALYERLDCTAFLRQFLLHAADEDGWWAGAESNRLPATKPNEVGI